MILEIVSKYVEIQKKGRNHVGLCPFHDDKNASLNVSESKNGYKCFACGAGGGPIKFVQEIEHISADQAKVKINAILGYEAFKASNIELDQTAQVRDIAAKIYHLFLTSPTKYPDGLKYLDSRKINRETAIKFNLGYAIGDIELSNSVILNENNVREGQPPIKRNDLLNAGLMNLTKSGDFMPVFTNRLVIPVYDLKNTIVGFTARDLTNKSEMKYFNSINFKKGEHLFGVNLIGDDAESITICEGIFDCIVLQQLNINAIALMGIEFTSTQIDLLKRFKNLTHIKICMDNDMPGIKASLKLYKELRSLFPKASFSFFDYYDTNVKDISELYCSDENLLSKRLERFVDYYTYYTNYLLINPNQNRNEKLQALGKMKIEKSLYDNIILSRLCKHKYFEITNKFVNHDAVRELIMNNEHLIDGILLDKIKDIYKIKE